jgi:hypothetical protein
VLTPFLSVEGGNVSGLVFNAGSKGKEKGAFCDYVNTCKKQSEAVCVHALMACR